MVLQGAQLMKAPSMTLSESQALDSFDFLGADDTSLLHRMSRISFSEGSEGVTPSLPCLSLTLCLSPQIISALPHSTSVRILHTSLLEREGRGWRTAAYAERRWKVGQLE